MNMKKLLSVMAVIAITLFSCSKQAGKPSAPKALRMSVAEVKSILKIDLIAAEQYYSDLINARGGPKKPPHLNAATQVDVMFDLVQTITNLGATDSVHTTLPIDPTFGGTQSAVAKTPTGGLDSTSMRSECNWYVAAWDGIVIEKSCIAPASRPKAYRSWSSDIVYNVHLSPVEELLQ
jgi:hypothetical protein